MTCLHDHGNSNGGNSDYDNSNRASQLYSRRGIVVALASTTVLCADPSVASAFAASEDQAFMRLALDEARHGDYPFGAVIVRDDKVIARGRNLGKVHDDPTAHAEMTAIRRALAEHGSAALRGSTPLRDRRAVLDVHGRNHMVPFRAARFRRVHKAIGHQD